MLQERIHQHREFMKSLFGTLGEVVSDQDAGRPAPALQKPPQPGQELIELPQPEPSLLRKADVHRCIAERRSRRRFSSEPLGLPELAYLLWATQGVQSVVSGGKATLRTVPSGGARHPFETYVLLHRVAGPAGRPIEPGICRYLPLSHQLVRLTRQGDLPGKVVEACNGQDFVGASAAVFVWACMPYRAEWRYHLRSHKTMLLDAGHICQNLYLACEALGAGTCAVAAYSQPAMDALLGLDGRDEFVVYLAPVGWPS